MAKFNGILSGEELRELKRNEIIRCASSLFAENGYRNTSLTSVAAGVGVTKAALYNYISSKEELLFLCEKAVVQQALDITNAAWKEPVPPLDRLLLALGNLIRAITGAAIRYIMIYEIFDDSQQIEASQASEIRSLRDQVESNVRAMVLDAVADGSLNKNTDAKLAGFMILGSVIWVTRWYRKGGAWSPDYIAEVVPRYALQSFMTDALHPELVGPEVGAVHSDEPRQVTPDKIRRLAGQLKPQSKPKSKR